MHEALFQYIYRYTGKHLTDTEIKLIEKAFLPKKLRKRQYFLQEGDICKYFAFIVHGAMRQYSVDEKGHEHILQLGIENWWIGDRESYIMLTPTAYNIDAWEDSDLLLITRADLLSLLDQVPIITQMTRQMDDKNAFATQRRLNATISYTAEKRYQDFLITHPDILQRFPQHQIASYLGITKETLSRIRKQTI